MKEHNLCAYEHLSFYSNHLYIVVVLKIKKNPFSGIVMIRKFEEDRRMQLVKLCAYKKKAKVWNFFTIVSFNNLLKFCSNSTITSVLVRMPFLSNV